MAQIERWSINDMRYLNLGFLVVLSLVIGCSGPPSVPDRPEESQVETGPLVDGPPEPTVGLTRYGMTHNGES